MKNLIAICFFLYVHLAYSQMGKNNIEDIANDFISVLTPDLREKTLFDLNSSERTKFYFVPIERRGVSLNDLNKNQKKLALKLLRSSLSKKGFDKAQDIRMLEKVLLKIEQPPLVFNGKEIIRDYLDYHFWIFGLPSKDSLWGWKFEGHHISFNFVAKNNKILSSTPSFLGSNPAIVDIDGFKKQQILKDEMDLGVKLVSSLDLYQKDIAQFSKNAPIEIITKNKFKVQKLKPKGIGFNELKDNQRIVFLKLLNEYINNYRFGFSEDLRKKVYDSGIENLYFAYAGEINSNKGFYYRIQGGSLLIEYDNIQNDANHVHTVVRDLSNDWAESILKNHYDTQH
ncbi:MAG: hypothetical protein CBE25_03880 [Flavobacteriaceae bacterium TMED265]|nr:MAG: hypothetical protein CBE25_03880 [Flavobacteriaceae bacterium TMED265]